MQISSITNILAAKRQGDRSYILVFEADSGRYEVFLPGSGYPGVFEGFMAPSLRNQVTGESRVLEWAQAELLAEHLGMALCPTGKEESLVREAVCALKSGRRYGAPTV